MTIARAASFLGRRLSARPEIAVILGSGLGDLDLGPVTDRLPYAKIPGFPRPGVGGHAGVLTAGGRVVVLRGRSHYYEGRSMEEVVRPVRILARLGVKTLILTNAAGAVNPKFRPGDLMLIRDHLNLMGVHPLRGAPSFVDLTVVYDRGLRKRVRLHEGVLRDARGGPDAADARGGRGGDVDGAGGDRGAGGGPQGAGDLPHHEPGGGAGKAAALARGGAGRFPPGKAEAGAASSGDLGRDGPSATVLESRPGCDG